MQAVSHHLHHQRDPGGSGLGLLVMVIIVVICAVALCGCTHSVVTGNQVSITVKILTP